VTGGQGAVEPILLRPQRFRHRYSAERLSLGIRRLSLVKAVVEREAGAPAVGENDRFVVLRENARAGFFGPIRSSDVDSRAFHLAIVLRLTPYRLARATFFSSLSWIARRTLGVVVAQECVCGCAARPRFRATRTFSESPLNTIIRQKP